jgi:L-ribulose-5-phosphate 3-epimerase
MSHRREVAGPVDPISVLASPSRRDLLRGALLYGAAWAAAPSSFAATSRAEGGTSRGLAPTEPAAPPQDATPLFTISLAEWSLHRALRERKLDHLDFPRVAKAEFGIDAVEYVNSFFAKKADPAYLADLRKRCDDHGVQSVLIMCDGEGALGDPDEPKRKSAVDNHRKWLDAAKALGCGGIRVNAQSEGTAEEQLERAADGLRRLCELADPLDLFVIVENHGGLSSSGAWLASVMRKVGHKRVGTLPDFGNFDLGGGKKYDRYEGVRELMPYAKGVSAKSYAFDAKGEEKSMSYLRLLRLVTESGYRGRIGIEYEGDAHSEPEGIKLTKALLEKVRALLAAERAPASKPSSRPK